MWNRFSSEHLSPETFVDVLEGAPVDAAHRQHLSACQECRGELDGLEKTLSTLKSARDGERGANFSRRLWRYARWASAAAVLVLTLVSQTRAPSHVAAPAAPEGVMLLPPIDDDGDYRLLLALAREAGDSDVLLDAVQFSTPFSSDPSELTPDERERLGEEIAEALRSSS